MAEYLRSAFPSNPADSRADTQIISQMIYPLLQMCRRPLYLNRRAHMSSRYRHSRAADRIKVGGFILPLSGKPEQRFQYPPAVKMAIVLLTAKYFFIYCSILFTAFIIRAMLYARFLAFSAI